MSDFLGSLCILEDSVTPSIRMFDADQMNDEKLGNVAGDVTSRTILKHKK